MFDFNSPDVLLLAAGAGSRMGSLSNWPKCLLPVGGKAILGWLLETWGQRCTFWIAVPQGDFLIESYVMNAYPDYVVNYIPVNTEYGHPVGPVYSLSVLYTEYLQFKDRSDRLVVSVTDGVYKRPDLLDCYPDRLTLFGDYRDAVEQVDYANFYVTDLNEPKSYNLQLQHKTSAPGHMSWSGVALLPKNSTSKLSNLIANSLADFADQEISLASLFHSFGAQTRTHLFEMTFDDYGTYDKYVRSTSVHDLSKDDQMVYTNHSSNRVVKLWKKDGEAAAFAARARNFEHLGCQYVFPRTSHAGQGAAYQYIEGTLLSENLSIGTFCKFLSTMHKQLWVGSRLTSSLVHEACVNPKLYWPKTQARLLAYAERNPEASTLLDFFSGRNYWKDDEPGVKTPVHGDLTFDNVLVQPGGRFFLIDWRTSVAADGKHRVHGDLYYDLAKIWVSLSIDFQCLRSQGVVSPEPVQYFEELQNYVESNGCDYRRVCKYGVLLIAAMPARHSDAIAKVLLEHAIYLAQEHYSDWNRK